ncbi:MAG: DEAD/DEAH box helicase [Akkermansiaceae bacterium]
MADFNQITAFLTDCLRHERAGSGIPNLFATKVLRIRFIKGEEKATTHEFASLDLPSEIEASLMNAVKLRGRDCELLYATLPITGTAKGKKVCAPLLLYPLVIDHDSLRLELAEVRLNPAVASLFELPVEFTNSLLDDLPDGTLSPVTPEILAKEIKVHLPDLDLSELSSFPRLHSSGEVRESASLSNFKILPASAVILSRRSKNVAGLLQEIETLSKTDPKHFSAPLRVFLGDEASALSDSSGAGNPQCIPALLSKPQLDLIESVNHHSLSVCQGPPGTGKSFSLVASAAEQILCGRSVLIACRTNEAADVLEAKLRELMPNSKMMIRAGRKSHLRALKSKIEAVLYGGEEAAKPKPDRHLNSVIDRLYHTEVRIRKEIETALETGEWFRNPPDAWWTKLRKWFHLKKLKNKPVLAEALALFYRLHQQRLIEAKAHNRFLHFDRFRKALNNLRIRKTLVGYRDALKTIYASRQEEALHKLDPTLLFQIFPVWITTTDDLHRVLPFKPGLFDVAIIDEATQCDLASALPVLHRAKRALIAGDPKQLRHLSFLPKSRLKILGEKHKLSPETLEQFNFREVSLINRALDQVIGSQSFTFLNEHFRSKPSLIQFSNAQFYDRALLLMRESEVVLKKRIDQPPLNLIRVNGQRSHDGVNEGEIDEAIRICRQLEGADVSIGFISPFRAQVEVFLDRLQNSFPRHILRHFILKQQLTAGTSHSFQGDERDHMILSFAIDEQSPLGARRFLERPDVFNVAITRARDRLDVLHSVDPTSLPLNSLVRRFLEQETQFHRDQGAFTTTLSDLAPALGALGWKTVPKQSLSGVPTDLVLVRDGKMIAIDLIGTSGEEGLSVELSKALILQRTGVPLYPIRIDEWLHCKNRVIEFFHALK